MARGSRQDRSSRKNTNKNKNWKNIDDAYRTVGTRKNTNQKHGNHRDLFDDFDEDDFNQKFGNGTQKPKKEVKLTPRGKNQSEYAKLLEDTNTYIVCGVGPAGSGKTMLATQAAVKGLIEGRYKKIVITRPNEEVDNKGIGFLPGNLEAKMNPFLLPILDVMAEIYSQKEIDIMIKEKIIEVVPIAFIRGRTFKKSIILVDEAQGTTENSLLAILTRLGEDSKMIITGDVAQSDRIGNNGLSDFLKRISKKVVDGIAVVYFNKGDIQRHPIIGAILKLYDKED